MNYYNDNDQKSADRLRALVSAGLIPPGDVDTRSILHVIPSDLAGYTQCHFFAGIGGWSEALRLAGIPATTRLWTGSCPCQPFSPAGKRKGTDDERHLWPVFRDLIAQCRPPIVFGEQVASADGRAWLSTVRLEMEALGYAVGAADLCAAGIGAPHPRQRLWFVGLAHADSQLHNGSRDAGEGGRNEHSDGSADGRLANADSERHDGIDLLLRADPARRDEGKVPQATGSGCDGGLANADNEGPQGRERVPESPDQCTAWESGVGGGLANAIGSQFRGESGSGNGSTGETEAEARERKRGRADDSGSRSDDSLAESGRPSQTDSFWAAADWLYCRDGKWRPAEPAAQQMVDGISCAVEFLRAEKTLKEELTNASKTSDLAGQVMRALRENHAPTEIWWSIGRRIGLPETTLLLAALCEQSRELGELLHGKAESCAQDSEEPMPTLRGEASPDACPPHGRRCAEQLTWELGDALSELPQTCPSSRSCLPFLAEYTGSPLANKVPGRVALIKGYGNAIVPQVAATFIRAALMP